MRRFWTRGRTRVLTLGAAIVVCLAVGASIGGAAIGGLVAAAPGKLAHGAHVFAGSSSSAQENQYPKGKTTICHRTGSQSNPFVTITVSNRALKAHAKHGDIIPAPAGGCPTTATPPADQVPESAQVAPRVKAPKVHKTKKAKKAKHAKKHSVRSGLSNRSAETARGSKKAKKAKKSKPHQLARLAQKAQKAQKANRGGNGNGRGNGNGGGNGNGNGNAGGKKK